MKKYIPFIAVTLIFGGMIGIIFTVIESKELIMKGKIVMADKELNVVTIIFDDTRKTLCVMAGDKVLEISKFKQILSSKAQGISINTKSQLELIKILVDNLVEHN